CEVCKDIELQFERLTLGDNSLPVFTIRLGCSTSAAKIESKRVLPLLREALWIDVVIPQQRCGYERLWHFAAGKFEVRETCVTEVCLAHKDSVVVFRKWSVIRVGPKRDIC